MTDPFVPEKEKDYLENVQYLGYSGSQLTGVHLARGNQEKGVSGQKIDEWYFTELI